MLVIWKKGHLKKYKEECWYCGKKDISRNIKKNVGTVEKKDISRNIGGRQRNLRKNIGRKQIRWYC
jgi:hypothetical protein